jgi:hypothetical protein
MQAEDAALSALNEINNAVQGLLDSTAQRVIDYSVTCICYHAHPMRLAGSARIPTA